jgi:hypothetical protein
MDSATFWTSHGVAAGGTGSASVCGTGSASERPVTCSKAGNASPWDYFISIPCTAATSPMTMIRSMSQLPVHTCGRLNLLGGDGERPNHMTQASPPQDPAPSIHGHVPTLPHMASMGTGNGHPMGSTNNSPSTHTIHPTIQHKWVSRSTQQSAARQQPHRSRTRASKGLLQMAAPGTPPTPTQAHQARHTRAPGCSRCSHVHPAAMCQPDQWPLSHTCMHGMLRGPHTPPTHQAARGRGCKREAAHT